MSKKDPSKNKKESTKDQEKSNKEAVASVPLEDYEKIKDDYLRPVSYTHLTLPTKA